MFGIIIGMNSGLVRSGPMSMSFSISWCRVWRPPTPLPIDRADALRLGVRVELGVGGRDLGGGDGPRGA